MERLRYRLRVLLDHRTTWMRIMAVALLLRGLLLWQLHDVSLESDSLYYYQVAQSIAAGESFSTYWPPGLPLYEAAAIKLTGGGEFMMRLSMLLWFLLFCRLLYNLLNRLHSRVAANIALAVVAFYPAFVHQSVEPLSQLPAATLLLALFFGLYRYLNGGKAWQFYVGMALGALILFRPSAVLFLLLVPVVLFFQGRKILAAANVVLIALIMVSLWVWRASENSGRFVPVNEANARNFYLGNNAWTPHYKTWIYGSRWVYHPEHPAGFREELQEIESVPPSERSLQFTRVAFREIGRRPEIFLLRTANRARVYFSFDTFAGSQIVARNGSKALAYPVLVLDGLMFIGLGLLWLGYVSGLGKGEMERRYLGLSHAFVIIYTLPYLFSFSHPSYHLPVVPLILLPAAVLLARPLLDRTFRWRTGWKWKAAAAVFLLIQAEWIWRMGF